jgi:hypothetical protein
MCCFFAFAFYLVGIFITDAVVGAEGVIFLIIAQELQAPRFVAGENIGKMLSYAKTGRLSLAYGGVIGVIAIDC